MGQNLILNMNDHGFVVVAYNRTTAKVDQFLENEVIIKKKKNYKWGGGVKLVFRRYIRRRRIIGM